MRIIRSLPSVDDIAEFVTKQWDLPGALSVHLLNTSMREVYEITYGADRRVLYLYPAGRQTAEVESEWQLAAHLRSQSINVPVAIPARDGSICLPVALPEGIRLAVLCEFIDGRLYRGQPTETSTAAFGSALARMHQASDGLDLQRSEHGLDFFLDSSMEAISAAYPEEVRLNDALASAAPVIRERVGSLPREIPAFGLIHGDVIRANAIVAPDGSLWIIDLDLCGLGWRAYDVASFLVVSLDGQEDLGQAFLDAYDCVRPLTDAEVGRGLVKRCVKEIRRPPSSPPQWTSAPG